MVTWLLYFSTNSNKNPPSDWLSDQLEALGIPNASCEQTLVENGPSAWGRPNKSQKIHGMLGQNTIPLFFEMVENAKYRKSLLKFNGHCCLKDEDGQWLPGHFIFIVAIVAIAAIAICLPC